MILNKLFTALITSAALFSLSTTFAEARRGASIHTDYSMEHVQDIDSAKLGTTDELSLCAVVQQKSILGFANFWRSKDQHVFAKNRCDTDSYNSFDAEQFAKFQEDGVIDGTLAYKPKMSIKDYFSGFWVLWVIGGFVLFAIWKKIQSMKLARARRGALGDVTPVAEKIVFAMAAAAKADGRIDEAEVKQIHEIANKMADDPISMENVRAVIANTPNKMTEADFKSIANGLRAADRNLTVTAVLNVVAADGELDEKEKHFLGQLCSGLGVNEENFASLWMDFVSTRAS
ncbi:hypothetical protein GCM10008927_03280 [Amylibacter ulvae]|uniref:Co-chaperone DjlA N-terminal domain-containing protein n=1 Tax=Paramylibacter ulvae TaxID=1651968 RepID=A0ABQ3CYE1_9RHOB|nr:TerB family tellurite resistance protein [Amylibacter ulvae]GHA42158.1 hypothetical protein GCM10008927_03280 [Amylibacter ulvae]